MTNVFLQVYYVLHACEGFHSSMSLNFRAMWLLNVGNVLVSYPDPYSHTRKKEVRDQGAGSASPGVAGSGHRSRTGDRTVPVAGIELIK